MVEYFMTIPSRKYENFIQGMYADGVEQKGEVFACNFSRVIKGIIALYLPASYS
ncbi:hypothetical protein XNC3_660010 [Xenorhabdus nematophila F1]|nr:hypothetical protein XNC3_660010 [Xenorhabdus nematophila F1]CEF32882.1 hypothetical protein XNW1_4540021 [Xenorhabdus nematophila str. Websteri]